MERPFRDRTEAGELLSQRLKAYANRSDVLVLGLPRGGVPVAFEVARALSAPMDIFVVRKLGTPGQEELAMGAISTGGVRVLNDYIVKALHITNDEIDSVAAAEQKELERRERVYRGNRPAPNIRGRTVILVDDGIATGTTMRAAVAALKQLGPSRIVAAVAVGPPSTFEQLKSEVDEVVFVMAPEQFWAISQWYEEFPQLSNGEVISLLERSSRSKSAGESP